MEISEFVEATSRLEQYYGKEYRKEQLQIMFEELKEMQIERYKQLVSQAIKTCKFLPKVADFTQLDKEVQYTDTDKEENEKIECKKCNSTGYIVYTKKIKDGNKPYYCQYAALCDCGNAKQYKGWEISDKAHRSNYYIPTVQELRLT